MIPGDRSCQSLRWPHGAAPRRRRTVARCPGEGRDEALRLAMLAEPIYPWRIVTSDRHSTVWNGDGLLFGHNFLALGVPPDECFADARRNGEVLAPEKYMRVHRAAHYRGHALPWARGPH
jgi:hypothetical protein